MSANSNLLSQMHDVSRQSLLWSMTKYKSYLLEEEVQRYTSIWDWMSLCFDPVHILWTNLCKYGWLHAKYIQSHHPQLLQISQEGMWCILQNRFPDTSELTNTPQEHKFMTSSQSDYSATTISIHILHFTYIFTLTSFSRNHMWSFT